MDANYWGIMCKNNKLKIILETKTNNTKSEKILLINDYLQGNWQSEGKEKGPR